MRASAAQTGTLCSSLRPARRLRQVGNDVCASAEALVLDRIPGAMASESDAAKAAALLAYYLQGQGGSLEAVLLAHFE